MRLLHKAGLLALVYGTIASAAFADDTNPVCRQFVENSLAQAGSIIHDADTNFTQKHQALVQLFESTLDLPWITETVAGAYWRNANDAERKTYAKVYRAYLSDYYISGFSEDDLKTITTLTVTSFRPEETGHYDSWIEIKQTDDDPIIAEIKLVEDSTGQCHIHDFTAEGVSMVDSQREEIQSLGAKGGLPFIAEKLSTRSAVH